MSTHFRGSKRVRVRVKLVAGGWLSSRNQAAFVERETRLEAATRLRLSSWEVLR